MAHIEDGNSSKRFVCNDQKKNVFLIGDSIRLGYCYHLKNALLDEAETFYINDNCRNTQYVISSLHSWAELFDCPEKIDVVLFNCGHWDIAHWEGAEEPLTSKDEYRRNVAVVIRTIRKLFKNAKVLFATTTPMNPSGIMGINPRSNEEIDAYNKIAVEVCDGCDVPTFDLNAFCRDWDSTAFADYCHFKSVSAEKQGKALAKFIKTFF